MEVNSQLGMTTHPTQQPRLRGREVTRLEALSDAVFGFAATLLVVSLEVPQTFPELTASLRGFVAFAFSFTMLILIWAAHNGFFRRYGLQDSWTVLINSVLLFVVLFYVYPLKFLSTALSGVYLRSRPGEAHDRRRGRDGPADDRLRDSASSRFSPASPCCTAMPEPAGESWSWTRSSAWMPGPGSTTT